MDSQFLTRDTDMDKDLNSHHGKSGGSVVLAHCIYPGRAMCRSGEADDGQHRMAARA